jgi:nitrite reductase/ring-hydroxylating ferredoxin subunit
MDDGWVPVLKSDLVADGRSTRAAYDDDFDVLLHRHGDRLFAIGLRCTHQGSPLDHGPVNARGTPVTVTCPAHGSMFDLETGRVIRGPATTPIEAFETRVVDGMIELKLREG